MKRRNKNSIKVYYRNGFAVFNTDNSAYGCLAPQFKDVLPKGQYNFYFDDSDRVYHFTRTLQTLEGEEYEF